MLEEHFLLSQCEVRRQRRSGPGGQHRNKVETAVYLVHNPTRIEAGASERRSQAANRTVAIHRLRVKLAVAVRAAVADGRRPSDLWNSRLQGGRVLVHVDHHDFPALLAEAMDFVSAENYDLASAATRLGCTASQLVRLVKKEPSAFLACNQARQLRGLRLLR
jgi:hypothetical protein